MNIRILDSTMGLRNSQTRLPFRYGKACLTRCPQAVLRVQIEADGKQVFGYSGDCLPPGWFDKTPGKPFSQQIEEMLAVVGLAQEVFGQELAMPSDFFSAWLTADCEVHARMQEKNLPALLASFGVSMVERALLDAMARAAEVSFFDALQKNLYGIVPGEVHRELASYTLSDWLPDKPTRSIYVRHTVGLTDPLTTADIPEDERLRDGKPQALEEYLQHCGIRYLKIKVSNQLQHDIDRLKTIAALVQRYRGQDYCVTLDGNEQYAEAGQFDELMDRLRATPELETLLANTLVIEQPLDRKIALDVEQTHGIRELCRWKPVIIDESDSETLSYAQAIELGYRGTSSKNCKGPVKSLLNAGLTWLHNKQGTEQKYLMTGEDLCTVGIVPVQADLCLVAALGLTHVERNGHHYHPGLSYLPPAQAEAALAAHGDLYERQDGMIAPNPSNGKFEIGSLQCSGFGFAVEPDLEAMERVADWQFSSLGLQE